MKAFAKLYWLFSASICNFTNAVIIQGTVPKSLWGKKVVLNGPQGNSQFAFISKPGHITSVNLIGEKHVVVSEAFIKPEKEGFNVGDLYNKDFAGIFRKIFASKSPSEFFSTGFCNAAVHKYDGKYYALEETCRPMELEYDETGKIHCVGLSKDIERMGAHLIDEHYTRFSYMPPFTAKAPLKYNDTVIPWYPEDRPALIHDGKITECGNYMIFPLTSLKFGNIFEWLSNSKPFPFDIYKKKFRWLLFDYKNFESKEIYTDIYIDIFHVFKVEKHDHKTLIVYASAYENFWETSIYIEEPILTLHKHIINIEENTVKVEDLKFPIEFANIKDTKLVGNGGGNPPKVTIFDIKTNTFSKKQIPGKIVEDEIIPFEDMLIYYTHEENRSFLYIIDKESTEIITKIQVPKRKPGIHTTLLD
jgi:hypothetical protein